MLKAEPLRTFPSGRGLHTELTLLQDCHVLETYSVAGGTSLAPFWDHQICAEGVLGEMFWNYRRAPHPNLHSHPPT